MTIVDDKDIVAAVLTAAASAVADTLSAARIDAETMAFAIVVWPIGEIEHCSSVFGSGSGAAASEAGDALAVASKKMKTPATLITHHTSGRSN